MTEEQTRMDPYHESRSCKECGVIYTIGEIYESSSGYFDAPYTTVMAVTSIVWPAGSAWEEGHGCRQKHALASPAD
jgi:hypothetical protein